MSKNTKIQWAHHTFNPWIGCAKVSPGCAHCYAEAIMDKRLGRAKWGPGQPRQRTSSHYWRQPLHWDAECEKAGRRDRVFCSSLADWLDPEIPIEWLCDLLNLIRSTPNLDWLLLTKRPELWRRRMGEAWHDARNYWAIQFTEGFSEWLRSWSQDLARPHAPGNVWIGTSVEDQERADLRIPALLKIPAKRRFLSCEPLLGPVDLAIGHPKHRSVESYHATIDWVICGGESGPKARSMQLDWARDLRRQCQAANTPFFFKQVGSRTPDKGGELLDGIRIQELPE